MRNRRIGVRSVQQNVIKLPKMPNDIALYMLRKCLIDQSLVDENPADAKAMLTWLTHLPLAIAQAATYINENGITLADYLALVDSQGQETIDPPTEHFVGSDSHSEG
jgi:hypothetical protein